MPTPNSSIIRMLDALLRMASLFLKKWAADLSDHYEELSNYQSGLKETSPDIINEYVFKTHDCVYDTFIGQLFKPNRHRKITAFQPFEMSTRTRARISNEYAMDQLRKNFLSLGEFADCAASIQLLSCFRTKGDPDSSMFYTSFLPFCVPFLRTSIQFYILHFSHEISFIRHGEEENIFCSRHSLSAPQPELFSIAGALPWLTDLFPQAPNSMKGIL